MKLIDCKKSKWVDSAIMKIGDIVHCRLNAEFKRRGKIKEIGNYTNCAEIFTKSMINYTNECYFPSEPLYEVSMKPYQSPPRIKLTVPLQPKIKHYFNKK